MEAAVKARMKEVHLLDMLCRTDQRLNWSSQFGPLSGADPKMKEARAHHILTVFAYATNLGPYQLAHHLRGEVDGETLAKLNRRHVTTEKLEAALRDVINRFNRCTLPRCWGTGKRAAADGTQYDLAEENLLAEQHIRYGGFGGIAYHHVSDLYILLFSHFIACGVWDAIYIIDGLMKNQSEIQPDTIHADIMYLLCSIPMRFSGKTSQMIHNVWPSISSASIPYPGPNVGMVASFQVLRPPSPPFSVGHLLLFRRLSLCHQGCPF